MTIEQQKSIDFFKKTIINIMHDEFKKPLGKVLHDCGKAKAEIKHQFPKYEKKNSTNKNDNYDWDAFFSENMTPDFEIEHNVKWQDGRKSDAIKYNKYAPTNKNKLGDNAIIITKETKKPTKSAEVKQIEKIESKQIKTTDMDNTENQNQDEIRERIEKILSYLNQNLYGKEEAVRLALLSAIANESIFFLGPPGTAKSMISRRIAAAFSDFYKDGKFSVEKGNYFEYLMNEFSTPDEICGPVDLSVLNETPSRYERQTKGYLPSANVAFLDEIWKSGPAILNTLLTIINEKKFHNGNKVEKVPLVSLAAASNELPQKDRGLEALWDRFILRVLVNPVEDDDDFFNILEGDNQELKPSPEQLNSLLSIKDVTEWQEIIDCVELSDEAKNVITAIRKALTLKNEDENHKDDESYYVSDRRWKKIVHVLKTSAFLNGRDAVDLMDCSLIEYAIWNTDKQHKEVSGIFEEIFKQNCINIGTAIDDIKDEIENFNVYIDEKFYESTYTPKIYTMSDGNKAYKIKKPSEILSYNSITPYYLCKNYKHDRNDRFGAYYDKDSKFIGDYDYFFKKGTFDINDNKVSWQDGYSHKDYTFTIEMNPKELIKRSDVFNKGNEDFYKMRKDAADKMYNQILDEISNELASLSDFEITKSAPLKSNFFAKTGYCNVIMSAVVDSKKELENAKLDLEKKRSRYLQ